MSAIKTIAIIDATSEMGAAIAGSLMPYSTYEVLLFSEERSELATPRKKVNDDGEDVIVWSTDELREKARSADVFILATDSTDEGKFAERIREVAVGKVVISTSNAMVDAYYHGRAFEKTSSAEELQKLLPHSRVVKAFNTFFPTDFVMQSKGRERADVFIAGNNGNAVEMACELVTCIGFNPVAVGDLAVSRELEQTRVKLMMYKLKEYNWLGIGKYFNSNL